MDLVHSPPFRNDAASRPSPVLKRRKVNSSPTPLGKLRFGSSSARINHGQQQQQQHHDEKVEDQEDGFCLKRVGAFDSPERGMDTSTDSNGGPIQDTGYSNSDYAHPGYNDRQSPVRVNSSRSTRVGAPKRDTSSRSRLDINTLEKHYDDEDHHRDFSSPGVPPPNCNPFFLAARNASNKNGGRRNTRMSLGSTAGAATPLHHGSSALAFEEHPGSNRSSSMRGHRHLLQEKGNDSSWLFRSPVPEPVAMPANKKGKQLHFRREMGMQENMNEPFQSQTPMQKRRQPKLQNALGEGGEGGVQDSDDMEDSPVHMLSRTLHRTCSVSARTHANMTPEMIRALPPGRGNPIKHSDHINHDDDDDDSAGFVLSSAFNPASSPRHTSSLAHSPAPTPTPCPTRRISRCPPVPTDAFTNTDDAFNTGIIRDVTSSMDGVGEEDSDAFSEARTPVVLHQPRARRNNFGSPPSAYGAPSSPTSNSQQQHSAPFLALARTPSSMSSSSSSSGHSAASPPSSLASMASPVPRRSPSMHANIGRTHNERMSTPTHTSSHSRLFSNICDTPKTVERPNFCDRQSDGKDTGMFSRHSQQPASSPLVGRDVSRFDYEFQVQGVLGSGGFGTVYKCRKRLDGCLYAVKVTNQRFRGELDKEHVLKEVYALAALCNSDDNPHIVRYFSAWVEDARLYIQTELCDMSLADLLRERNDTGNAGRVNNSGGDTYSTPEALVVELVKQMLLGLKTLHLANVVHLDIKPENIFIKNGTYKLGDLGHACLARMTTNKNNNNNSNSNSAGQAPMLVRSSSIMSTASQLMGDDECSGDMMAEMAGLVGDVDEGDSRYMARELLQEDYRRLTKADMFSLGASAYEVLMARQLPANGPEWDAIRSGIFVGRPGPNGVALADTSSACQKLLGLLMHPEAARRPSAQTLLTSGGPEGLLRSDVENELAKERKAANEYKKQLEQLRRNQAPMRMIRRVNTL